MSSRWRHMGAVAATVVAAFWVAPQALACSPASHCYGIATWETGTSYTGGLAYLNASRLSVYFPSSDWLNHEMWVTTGLPSANHWVEAGLTMGPVDGVNRGGGFFWAEMNSVGSYQEHWVQGINVNVTYIAKISHSGSGSWGVYLNGGQVGGSSHNHNTYTRRLDTGVETITDSAELTATSTELQKRSGDGSSWSYDWGGNIVQIGAEAGWGTFAKSMWSKFH